MLQSSPVIIPDAIVAMLKALVSPHLDKRPDQLLHHPEYGVYLERWKFLSSDGGAYIHRFHRSDCDAEWHDHPFDNVSVMLEGKWIEHSALGAREITPGMVVVRQAEEAHRIELIEGPSLSLFIVAAKRREWGFHTDDGRWIHNQEFFRMRGYN